MSTQFDTQHTHTDDTHAYAQPTVGRRAPRQGGNGPSGYRIAAIVIGTVIAAALIVLAAVGLTHITSTSTPRPPPPPRSRPRTRPSPPARPRMSTRRSRRPRLLPRQRR